MQVVEEPTRKGALVDLALTNKEGLVEDVKAGGRLGCSDHQTVKFRILHGGSRAISRTRTLDLRRADFALFKDLLAEIPWARGHFLHAQERCIPLRKKSRKGIRGLAWLNKELLVEIRWKRKVHGMWKEGQVIGKNTELW